MKTLDWIKANVHPDGGIRAWAGIDVSYPEVTGYLIPTLLNYGEDELARDFADWLLTVQNADGSFDGLDGVPRTFDTAACYEGLLAAFAKFKKYAYTKAIGKARTWLSGMQDKGVFYVDGKKDRTEAYCLRVNGIYPWYIETPEKLPEGRSHYLAYALEGLWRIGHRRFVEQNLEKLYAKAKDGLIPFYIGNNNPDVDTCATAQIACLMMQAGMDATKLMDGLESMVEPSGGLRLSNRVYQEPSWAVKFYLDARYHVGL